MAVEVARHFNTAVRWTFKLQMDMVSIQRLLEYANLEPEQAEFDSSSTRGILDQKLKGNLVFDKVEMRYQPHLEPALRDLSFKIEAREKVAIVGRTGAGKSSFF